MVVWDPAKAQANHRKHGILFSDAATVLDDPDGLTTEDDRYSEQRFVTLGADLIGRVLVVVYTYPEGTDDIRLISARQAKPNERKHYEKNR